TVCAGPYTIPSISLFFSPLLRHTTSSPFPYTTLFRSTGSRDSRGRPDRVRAIGRSHARAAQRIPHAFVEADRSRRTDGRNRNTRSEEHTSELQSLRHLVCRLLLEKKNTPHSSWSSRTT